MTINLPIGYLDCCPRNEHWAETYEGYKTYREMRKYMLRQTDELEVSTPLQLLPVTLHYISDSELDL